MTDLEFQKIKDYFENVFVVGTLNDAVTLSGRVPHLTQYALDHYKQTLDKYKLAKITVESTHSVLYSDYVKDSNKEYSKDAINTFINSDQRYMNIKYEADRLHNICIYLERTIDSLKQVSFNMKNVIDITRYLNGN